MIMMKIMHDYKNIYSHIYSFVRKVFVAYATFFKKVAHKMGGEK